MVTVALTTGMARERSRESADFDEFYSASVRGLTLQLYAYLGDLAEAQDVVHEALYRAFARWKQVSTYEDPRPGYAASPGTWPPTISASSATRWRSFAGSEPNTSKGRTRTGSRSPGHWPPCRPITAGR